MFLRMMASLLMLFHLGFWGSEAPAPASTTRIDRVVAVVDDAIITENDVQIEAQLLEVDVIPCPPLEPPQSDILHLLEDRRVLEKLAGSRGLYVPTPSEIVQRRTQLLLNLGDKKNSFMQRWGFTEDSLDRFLSKRMTAERYVNRNLGRSIQTEVLANTPEWEQTYRQRYRPWMEERRNQVSIRRVGASSP